VGSERESLPGAIAICQTDPTTIIEVTVVLRVCPSHATVIENVWNATTVYERQYFSLDQLGSDVSDHAIVQSFANQMDLDVVEVNPAGRTVMLSGTVAQLNIAFGVLLTDFSCSSGTYRGHSGPVNVTDELAEIVVAVVGLDNRPIVNSKTSKKRSITAPFTPEDISNLYKLPKGVNGAGQCVAIIELGGGFFRSDLANPSLVSSVSVNGAKNAPGVDLDADGEVALDIQVIQGVAPQTQIVVYFAPNTNKGFIDAVTKAYSNSLHCKGNKLTAISISWGGPESTWDDSSLTALDNAFKYASSLGVVVTAASGDNGSSDGINGTSVDFPASSPNVLGCGGTSVNVSVNSITSETVWNDDIGASGGGVSSVWPRPSYQDNVKIPFPGNRGVPDVSGCAVEWAIQYNGTWEWEDGTSAVAPLWAGLTALLSQSLGRPVGPLNPLIYNLKSTSEAFYDITTGNNGAYSACKGWDPCTGLGRPVGTKLLDDLRTKI